MTEYVAFSGGVDSTALALVMPNAIPVFSDTGWEFPETYKHIEKFEQITGREVIRVHNKRFPDGIPEYIRAARFMPSHGARFCTDKFKIKPFNKFLQNNPGVLNIALRADEPARVGNQTQGIEIRYPFRITGATRIDCLKICMDNDLIPRHPVYMARGGCKGCYYKRRSEVVAMCALVPHIMDELQELEEYVQDERERFFVMFPNVGCSIRDLRRQPLLFEPEWVYGDAMRREDYGIVCGMFCNR